jgi:hypothetical protein
MHEIKGTIFKAKYARVLNLKVMRKLNTGYIPIYL